jgi:aminoglycoside phosphotransferase (APT) family kinase protein
MISANDASGIAPDPPGIDPTAVSRWLSASVGLRPPLQFTRIGHGQSNLTYLVGDEADRRVVIRRPPLGELAHGAHNMLREHRILTALAAEPVPTPRPLGLSTDPDVTGATVYAMEYVDGIVLHTGESARELEPHARRRVGLAGIEALAALHQVDVDRVGLGDLGRRESYAERQLRGWGRQWDATKTRELDTIERIAQALRASIPPQREVALVHGDYSLANVIVGPDGEVRAILDWELSTLGDPVADLGTLLCYWPDRLEQAIPEREPLSLLPGFCSRQELIDAYSHASPACDLRGLQFWLALATWKLAIIFEGITRRRLENPGNSSTSAETLRRTTEHLVDLAATLV